MAELRDFLYLDVVRLHSFVSQIQGGLVDQTSETIKQLGGLSAGLNVGVPVLGGKAEASKSKESERQQTMQLTDPAYFNVLYHYLRQNKLIDAPPQTRKNVATGQFVEVHGTAELPVIEHWLDQLTSMFGFVERNFRLIVGSKGRGKKQTATAAVSNQQLREFKAILDCLVDFINLSRKDPGRQYIRMSVSGQAFSVWCGLTPDYVIIPLQSALPGDVHVIGRVERLLTEQETWKLVDLAQFSQAEAATKLIDMLNALNVMTGQNPITERSLQAQYPDFFVTPIAVFR